MVPLEKCREGRPPIDADEPRLEFPLSGLRILYKVKLSSYIGMVSYDITLLQNRNCRNKFHFGEPQIY